MLALGSEGTAHTFGAGIVRRERDGRHVRYYPGPAFDLVAARPA